MSTLRTIRVKSYLNVREERPAAAAFFPGHLLAVTSTGAVQKHAVAGGKLVARFAFEDELQGNGIDTAYASASKAQVIIPTPGDQVLAILQDGQNIVVGDGLESAGDGTLRKLNTGHLIGNAEEAIDLSDSSGAESSSATGYDKRILITIA